MSDWYLHIWYASEWVIRLVMLVYVPQRRVPAAARTWLLLIFLFPWPGLIVYAIIGRIYYPRRRIELQSRVSRHVRAVGADLFNPSHRVTPPLEPRFQQAVHLAENLGDFGILPGNTFELVAGYYRMIDLLVADIDGAKRHVHLLYYIFGDDDTGRRIVEALQRAVKRGVKCRVLIDSLGSRPARRTLAPRMREAGIEVLELLPVRWPFLRGAARPDLRNHRKIAVVDGHIGYVGSQNLINADFKKGLVYEELVVHATGPVVLQLQAVFVADLFFETEAQVALADLFPAPVATGDALAQVLPSGPGYAHMNTHQLILALIYAARQRLVITTPYFIPDDALLKAIQAAVLRGVDVHLVVCRQIDKLVVGLAQRSFYEELLSCGVQIHLYYRHFLHAKHLSIDDAVALIGSSNMDIRSFALNAEVSLIIYDSRVVAELRAVQEQYFSHCEKLSLESWQRRPLLAKVAENTARMVDSLL
jgi:cardiolipin synthase